MQVTVGRHKTAKFVAIGTLVVGLIPFPTETVPEWRVQYVDGKGRPVVGFPIEQTYQNYSFESTANVMTLRTNSQGLVVFPPHWAWAPVLLRILGPVGNVLRAGVHASFGPSSWLIPKCDVSETNVLAMYIKGKALPTHIVLHYEDSSAIRAVIPARDLLPVPAECASVEAQVKDK